MGSRFSKFKIKHQVQNSISNTVSEAKRIQNEIDESQADLERMKSDPNADPIHLLLLENAIESMKKNLGELVEHSVQFTVKQKRPSKAFPNGIVE